ncbi:eukaryotic translation initiation factor 4 gamma-like [Coccinella septempunctata]|uniref:eukaryotic translation initiation factor 4 gamma-like n=1 Tax=Coccinella septempunctata TaxID=41139 RepID=UPI001D079830|nr:eukaryotic translation initiation factor 4 gamma-like [Coccinella septempunctata]
MKFFIVEVVVTVAVIVIAKGSPIQFYATKYDHLDIEEILNNRRMVKYYANCLLSRGPCTPQGAELKRILPEALETNCLRCTEKQKAVTYQSIKRLKKEYPKTWALLETKWDPNNVYVRRFEESFRQTPSTPAPENEIIIENRFGDSDDDVTKPSTTTKTKIKTTKPTTVTVPISSTTPSTSKSTRRPSINSLTSASENKPLSVPQNNQNTGTRVTGVNVTNQVNQEDKSGNKIELSYSVQTSSTPRVPPIFTTSSALTSVTQNSKPIDSAGVIFDIPQSSVNYSQTTQFPQKKIVPTKITNVKELPVKKTPTRQPDPISQLVFSFLNANKPSTSKPRNSLDKISTTTSPPESPNLQIRLPKISGLIRRAGMRNRLRLESNTTVQISLRKPEIQVRLPGITVNNRVEGFNPIGNVVRGLANAGDRIIETGTSIADSVLTSVRDLFTPPARRNRASRRT